MTFTINESQEQQRNLQRYYEEMARMQSMMRDPYRYQGLQKAAATQGHQTEPVFNPVLLLEEV